MVYLQGFSSISVLGAMICAVMICMCAIDVWEMGTCESVRLFSVEVTTADVSIFLIDPITGNLSGVPIAEDEALEQLER